MAQHRVFETARAAEIQALSDLHLFRAVNSADISATAFGALSLLVSVLILIISK